MNYYEDLPKNYQTVNWHKDQLMPVGAFYQLSVSNTTSLNLVQEIVSSKKIVPILNIGANDRRFKKGLPPNGLDYSPEIRWIYCYKSN